MNLGGIQILRRPGHDHGVITIDLYRGKTGPLIVGFKRRDRTGQVDFEDDVYAEEFFLNMEKLCAIWKQEALK